MPPPKKPPPGRFADTIPPYNPLEPMPQPDVQEKSSDTTWEMWEEVKAKEGLRYADTQPMTKPGEKWAATQRLDPQQAGVPRAAPSSGATGLQKLTEESRRNNRVCPQPARWKELDGLLRSSVSAVAAQALPHPPLAPADWKGTNALAKRLMFRGVIDWAAENGQVETALKFVRALPEEEWHHMGE